MEIVLPLRITFIFSNLLIKRILCKKNIFFLKKMFYTNITHAMSIFNTKKFSMKIKPPVWTE